MIQKTIGSHDDSISILGFGGGRLPEVEIHGVSYPEQDVINEMIKYAYENGINYFDTAPLYCSGKCEEAIGKAVKDFRKHIFLAGKLQGEQVKNGKHLYALERTLKNLRTDYLDYYYFWGINWYFFKDYIMQNHVLQDVAKCKEEGLIRNIAFSFHGKTEELSWIIDQAQEMGVLFDACLVQYNLLDRSNEIGITYAHNKNIGTFAMGPVAGGRLAMPSDLYKKVHGHTAKATYELALQFVLGNPDMSVALSGMENIDMVRDNIKIANSMQSGACINWQELNEAIAELERFNELYCTGCKYCQPCPAGIKIQEIFKAYTAHNVYGLSGFAKAEFLRYVSKGGKTSINCLNCGQCEKRCPQHLSIRKELNRTEQILLAIDEPLFQFGQHEHDE